MARAFSSAATLAATLSDGVAVLMGRRGYAGAAAAAAAAAASKVRSSAEEKAVRKGGVSSSSSSDPWVPDPVTGYYRPGSRRAEADAAELKETHLSHSSRD